MSNLTDLLARAKAALEGVTPAPWERRTAPYREDEELPVATADKAEYQTGTLIGDGEPLHVLIADSPDPKFAYIVPAITGDGPTSERNAEFIAAARTLVPELVAELERYQRGGRTLGEQLDRTLRDILNATDSHDLIGEDGDGDWMLVFERLMALRPARDAALAEADRLKRERWEFSATVGFGDNIEERAAELSEMVDPIKAAFVEAMEHIECPKTCEQCGERLATTRCPDCHGSGCNGALSAASGAYAECEQCGGSGWLHDGCAEMSYADLATLREQFSSAHGAIATEFSRVEDLMLAAASPAETSRHANEMAGLRFALNILEGRLS